MIVRVSVAGSGERVKVKVDDSATWDAFLEKLQETFPGVKIGRIIDSDGDTIRSLDVVSCGDSVTLIPAEEGGVGTDDGSGEAAAIDAPRTLGAAVDALVSLRTSYPAPEALLCAKALQAVLMKVAANDNTKFRRLRVASDAFRRRIAPYEQAVSFLDAVGFVRDVAGEALELPSDAAATAALVFFLRAVEDAIVCCSARVPTLLSVSGTAPGPEAALTDGGVRALTSAEVLGAALDRIRSLREAGTPPPRDVRVFGSTAIARRSTARMTVPRPDDGGDCSGVDEAKPGSREDDLSTEDVARLLKAREARRERLRKPEAQRQAESIAAVLDSVESAPLRIVFPDGVCMIATFAPAELISSVVSVISERLCETAPASFFLTRMVDNVRLPESRSLVEEGLVPAGSVRVTWSAPRGAAEDEGIGWYLEDDTNRGGVWT